MDNFDAYFETTINVLIRVDENMRKCDYNSEEFTEYVQTVARILNNIESKYGVNKLCSVLAEITKRIGHT